MRFKEFLIEKEDKFLMSKLIESDLLMGGNKEKTREKILTEIRKTDTNITYKKSSKNLVKDYNEWIGSYPKLADAIFKLGFKTIGPGEILLYFIFDDIYLGGTLETADLTTKSGKVIAEVKGVTKPTKSGYITDFKLGTEANKASMHFFSNIINFINNYKIATGNYPPRYKKDQPGEIPPNVLKDWKKIDLMDKNLLNKNIDLNIELEMTKKGDIYTQIDNKKITNVNHKDALPKLKKLSTSYKPTFSKNKMISVQQVIDIWKDDILNSKIVSHPFLFLDTTNKMAIALITITKENLDVHRVSRESVRVALKI